MYTLSYLRSSGCVHRGADVSRRLPWLIVTIGVLLLTACASPGGVPPESVTETADGAGTPPESTVPEETPQDAREETDSPAEAPHEEPPLQGDRTDVVPPADPTTESSGFGPQGSGGLFGLPRRPGTASTGGFLGLSAATMAAAASGTVPESATGGGAARDGGVADAVPEDSHTANPSEPGSTLPPVDPEQLAEDAVEDRLRELSPAARVGQMFFVALDTQHDPVYTLVEPVAAMLREVQPGGVILFGSNVDNVAQVVDLVNALQAVSPVPLLIAIDEEGGRVSRLAAGTQMGGTIMPAAGVVGASQDDQLVYDSALVIGRELRALGVNMNMAPVADIHTNPLNTVIGDRAYGDDPYVVSELVDAAVRGFLAAGVIPVLKHFPGHGDTVQDSHVEMAILPHPASRIRRVELLPFESGIAAGAPAVMAGHITVPAFDQYAPASLSAPILEGLLRDELGFGGVVMTDALNMRATTGYYSDTEVALAAIDAGVDMLLHPMQPQLMHDAILAAVENGRVDAERVDESVRRILRLKYDWGILDRAEPASAATARSVLGAPEHRRVLDRILAQGRSR